MTVKSIAVLVLSCFLIQSIFAQKSFFETLEAHGPNAKYQAYGNLYKNDKGEPAAQAATTYHSTIEISKLDNLPAGITITKMLDNGKTANGNNYNGLQISAIKTPGYPNTAVLHHTGYNRGYVAIDNAIFFLHGLSDDLTDFTSIQGMLLVNGSAQKQANIKGKKKKKGKFWKALKNQALGGLAPTSTGEGTSAEYKELMAKNPDQLVRDYLKAMKAKQDSYTLTATDKNNIAKLKKAQDDYDAHVKRTNDAYWASPEGQAVLAERRRSRRGSSGGRVSLKNTSSHTIFVGSQGSSNRGIKIAAGSNASWDCGRDAYIQTETIVGTTSSYKSTSTKVYEANSSCGGSVTVY